MEDLVMEGVLEAVLEAISQEHPAALVTPVAMRGSLPTGRDARMLVQEDGTVSGTVGGGRMEADAALAAREAIREGRPRLIHFTLSEADALSDGLLCGGEATFLVEPVLGEEYRAVFGMMRRLIRDGVRGLEAVGLSGEGFGRRMAVGRDGAVAGSLGDGALDRFVLGALEEAVAEDRCDVVEAGEAGSRVFLNALQARPTVYIFGGGHVGLAVARVAPTAGFRVAVIDDREAFANRARFPMADAVYVMGFERALDGLAIDEFSYVVAMTRGHAWDREVVAQALRTRAAYIGMIGSRRKVALTFEVLKQQGFSDADIERVHAPIGLPIGGDSPGEIAISVVAELIRVRRRGASEKSPEVTHKKGTPVPWDVLLGGP